MSNNNKQFITREELIETVTLVAESIERTNRVIAELIIAVCPEILELEDDPDRIEIQELVDGLIEVFRLKAGQIVPVERIEPLRWSAG